tara:strand:+ start:456 stop:719 length:264 start_codon:yes stop_codon:yes gene_type:complete
MRYFKMTEDRKPNQIITIWVVREDGKEKCIYDPSNNYMDDLSNHKDDGSWAEWQSPEEMSETPMVEMLRRDRGITELTKDEAFLEMI